MERDISAFLAKISVFAALSENVRVEVAGKMTAKSSPAGTLLAVQGQTRVDHIYVIARGRLELYYDQQGEKTLSGTLESGDVFGGISLLMNAGVSVRTVKVTEPCDLYVMDKEVFLDLCRRHPEFYEHFVENFSQRLLDESYAAILAAGQAMDFLATVDPFSFLPREALQTVAAEVTVAKYPADTVMFIQNRSQIGHLHVIKSGAAERYYEENDRRKLQGVLGEGDLFGGISMMLNNGLAVRTLRTTEKCSFYRIAKESFLSICENHPAFSEYFTDTFGKRMLDRSYAAIIAKNYQPREAELRFFNRNVSEIFSPLILKCGTSKPIRQAAAEMSRGRCSSIFVHDEKGHIVGVVTDNDLRTKVIAGGVDTQEPVSRIMSSPLCTVSDQAQVFEALMTMMANRVKHLGITDAQDKVVGVVTNHDLLMAQVDSPVFAIGQIRQAAGIEEIIRVHDRVPAMIQSMINSGAKARNVTGLITMLSDAILKKLVGFALKELGPAPVPFVFMVLGSEGRKEQTLKTDQDNAIVFEDVPEKDLEEVQGYFRELGRRVCAGLDRAGYAFCEGEVMAQNPRWCQPLSVWKKYFFKWIRSSTPEALLQASIFFDFRTGYGDERLIDALHEHLTEALTGWAGFFRHLTENALYFKPPLGFFRNFVVESKGEHRNAFDIKSAMVPLVDFARIHALKNGLTETNTLERLAELRLRGALTADDFKELEQAYGFLMQMRFVRQVSAVIEDNARPDNYINPKKLSRIEQTMLKEIFKRIEKFQVKLSFDFIGIP